MDDHKKDSLFSLIFTACFSFICFLIMATIFMVSVIKNPESYQYFKAISGIMLISFGALPMYMFIFMTKLFDLDNYRKRNKKKEQLLNGDI